MDSIFYGYIVAGENDESAERLYYQCRYDRRYSKTERNIVCKTAASSGMDSNQPQFQERILQKTSAGLLMAEFVRRYHFPYPTHGGGVNDEGSGTCQKKANPM